MIQSLPTLGRETHAGILPIPRRTTQIPNPGQNSAVG
jgi:hypothetical protein